MKEWAGQRPDHNDANGDAESRGMPAGPHDGAGKFLKAAQEPLQLWPAGFFHEKIIWRLIKKYRRESRSVECGLKNGQLHAALDDAGADGVAGDAGGVVNVELLHKMFTMLLDGLDPNAKFRRGFLVGLAFGDQLQHFHLARG